MMSFSSVVGIATGFGLNNQDVGAQALIWSRILTFPYHPDRLLGVHLVLSNGYWGLFPCG
jgi:hypothetical protein